MREIIEHDAVLLNLPKFEEFVSEAAKRFGFKNSTIMQIELAIEEIIVNIISYAYPNGELGKIKLSRLEHEKGVLAFQIEDNGTPFNMLEVAKPDLSQPVETRDIGGLGIFLARQFMDEIEYKRENNKNILILTKNNNGEKNENNI